MAADVRREGLLAANRIAELQEMPVQGKFDADHLKQIHQRIFQDLPQCAPGKYRPAAEEHSKARALESIGYRYYVHYAPRSQVADGIDKTLAVFGGPAALLGLDPNEFSVKMANLYADMDYLHPFVEGNSRTLRVFSAQLAQEAGYHLDWARVNSNDAGRDHLYIARDQEVTKRAFPGLNEERAMISTNRQEYEAWMRIMAPFPNVESLQQIILKVTSRAQVLDLETSASNQNDRHLKHSSDESARLKKTPKSKNRDDFER
ncbi:MAG: Fic family protein [Burkholderiales bacterium]